MKYYAPDYELDVRASNMDNANSKEYLEKILAQVLENMKQTAHAPSVQLTDIPRNSLGLNDDDEAGLDDLDDDEHPDKRSTQRRRDKYIQKNGELSDSEDEDPEERQAAQRRRVQANYRHIMDVGANDSGVETGSAAGTPMQGSSLPDDADEMNIDSVGNTNQPPSPANEPANQPTNGSVPVSEPPSPAPAAPVEDVDVEMEDADAGSAAELAAPAPAQAEEDSTITVQQQRTPPESPPSLPQAAEESIPGPPTTTSVTAPSTTEVTEATEPATVTEKEEEATTSEEPVNVADTTEAVIKPEPDLNDEVQKAKAADEGRIEREVADAEGQARTEQVAKAEAEEPEVDGSSSKD